MERDRYLLLYDDDERRRSADDLGLEGTDGPVEVIDVTDLDAVEAAELDPRRVKYSARSYSLEHVEWLEGGDTEGVVVETDVGPASWGVAAVRADRSPQTGRGVRVAVLDTGIDHSHPAFKHVDIVARDFTGASSESGPVDRTRPSIDVAPDHHGHGTHCAATIVGGDVDGVRIGVAPGVTSLLVGKIHSENGLVSTDTLVDAMRWAVAMKADIISMSIGMNFTKQVERYVNRDGWDRAVATSTALKDYADNVLYFTELARMLATGESFHKPVAVVVAAGNHSNRRATPEVVLNTGPPAAAKDFISVGAVSRADSDGAGRLGAVAAEPSIGHKISWFSNQGSTCVAPGVGIVSASLGGGLTVKSGTSMAAPHVAGLLALWIERLRAEGDGPDATPRAVNRLKANGDTESLVNEWTRADYGEGLMKAPRT